MNRNIFHYYFILTQNFHVSLWLIQFLIIELANGIKLQTTNYLKKQDKLD